MDRLCNISSFIKHEFRHYFLQSFMHAQCIIQTRLKFIFWKLLTYNFVYILTKCYTKQNKMLQKNIWNHKLCTMVQKCASSKKKPNHNGECLRAFSFNHGGGEDSLSKPSSSSSSSFYYYYYHHQDDGSIYALHRKKPKKKGRKNIEEHKTQKKTKKTKQKQKKRSKPKNKKISIKALIFSEELKEMPPFLCG